MPAISGTDGAQRPEEAADENAGNAPFLHEGFAARDQIGMARQRPDMRRPNVRASARSNRTASRRRRRRAPPAIQTGQKLMPLGPISAPIATSAPQAGISSEMKASDSPNASANTIGGAHAALSRTKGDDLIDVGLEIHRGSSPAWRTVSYLARPMRLRQLLRQRRFVIREQMADRHQPHDQQAAPPGTRRPGPTARSRTPATETP